MKQAVRSNWERALLVCGKCSRKLGGGFGPKGNTSLAKILRREPGLGKGRGARVGVVEVKCLGVCPKHAVTVVDTGDPTSWHLVPNGLGEEEAARLLLADLRSAAPALRVASAKIEKAPTLSARGDQPLEA